MVQLPRSRHEMATLARTIVAMGALALRNCCSRAPLAGGDGPAVSLTSHSLRVRFVFLTLESIARGSLRPSRVILWLDEPAVLANPPRTLRRLRRRGLELLSSGDDGPANGPHNKWFPYAAAYAPHDSPVVTCDDDMLYPRRWLQQLADGAKERPRAVVAHRVDRIAMTPDGIAPYGRWTQEPTAGPSPRNIAYGVCGVLYPPSVLDALAAAGTAFRRLAPRQDDLYLHRVELGLGAEVVPVGPRRERDFLLIRGAGRVQALGVSNEQGGGNDRAVSVLYGDEQVAELLADREGAGAAGVVTEEARCGTPGIVAPRARA